MFNTELFTRMEAEYPFAAACYAEAVRNGTINAETFRDIVTEFMKNSPETRQDAEDMIRDRRERKTPDPHAPHCPEGTCHPECAAEPDTHEGRLGFHGQIMLKADKAIPKGEIWMVTENGLPEKIGGLQSGIALQAQYEAEMSQIQKDIVAQYIKIAYEPPSDDARDVFVKCSRCRYTSRKASEAAQCPQCRYIHDGKRRPAMPGVTQYRAADQTQYLRLQDPARDLVVILARSPDGMRFVQIEGKVWHLLSGRTNAPEGEVAITDDDLETLLQYEKTTKSLVFGSKAQNLGKLQDKLTRQLFMTDPDVHAYVALHAETPERFPGLMEKAFTMGWTRNQKYPRECAWVERCHSRACAMMGHDPDLK